jgi:glycosyltransferase involved in cell wall biosynthesis
MDGRLKVLISAYACNPYKGSEEGVGWGWVTAIARSHDVCVLTAEYHREDIEKALAEDADLRGRARFVYVPSRPWHYRPTRGWKFIENSVLKPIMNLSYAMWQKDAYKVGRALHERTPFDLVHLVTYVGFRFPGRLWKLDIPFVWGPIGGLENTPWRFLPMLGVGGAVYYAGRNVINTLQKLFLGNPRRAFAKAGGAIIAATEGIREEIRKWYGHESEVLCEIGPPADIAREHSERQAGEPLRISWGGLHLPGKALPLLLKALAKLPDGLDWRLEVLGDGPCTPGWRKMARKLEIDSKCMWKGWVSRGESVKTIHNSHVFVITSIKDLTSTVLLEALAQGVPVVCLDHCGFRNVVNETCGVKIPVTTPGKVVADLAKAIETLADDEPRRRNLAGGALKRIVDFTWDKKADAINAIYERAVSRERVCVVK